MPKKLTQDQIDSYNRDGFLPAQPALSREETAHYRGRLEAYEAGLGGKLTALPPIHARKTHVLLPWAAELVRHPALLDAIEDLIGPDILVYNATFFIKEARALGITAWHQDSTYFGLEQQEHVTCWVALSEASLEAGCMEFIPGSSGWGQMNHGARTIPNSINFGNQSVTADFDASTAVAAPVGAGEFTCHHTRVLHQSGPNGTDDRRIGLGISYIPAYVRHKGSMRVPATLVRGADRHGNFDLEPDPRTLTPKQAQVAHVAAYEGYRAGYTEQIDRHAAALAGEGA